TNLDKYCNVFKKDKAMQPVKLDFFTSGITPQKKKDVITTFLKTIEGVLEISNVIDITDQQWVRLHLPVVIVFFGITTNLSISYDEYELSLRFINDRTSKGKKFWKKISCSVANNRRV